MKRIRNQIRSHAEKFCLSISALYSKQRDPETLRAARRLRMTAGAGFTLVELLVVVLIIGILSAIAIPMYQVSVEKTKAANMLALLESIARAEEVYYLANGSYSEEINNLDVQIDYIQKKSEGGRMFYQLPNGYWINIIVGTYHQMSIGLENVYFTRFFNHSAHSSEDPGATWCYYVGNVGKQVCKSMGVDKVVAQSTKFWQ